MLNCVVIDDEQFSVDVITKYIKLLPRLSLTEIYFDPKIALEKINATNRTDIIFMDVDMPDLSGLELAGIIRPFTKRLIFTTSHSKYAFEAYEVDGDAFLLKPYTFTKFTTTINRLFPLEELELKSKKSDDYFLVKNKDENLRIVKVAFEDIIAFESFQNYVKIHISNNKPVTAYLTLADIQDLVMERKEFKQFHRAFIVSAKHISFIEGNIIYLDNKLSFNVGERYRDNFSNYLSNQLLKTTRKQRLI